MFNQIFILLLLENRTYPFLNEFYCCLIEILSKRHSLGIGGSEAEMKVLSATSYEKYNYAFVKDGRSHIERKKDNLVRSFIRTSECWLMDETSNVFLHPYNAE
jgi:hypothetical protein